MKRSGRTLPFIRSKAKMSPTILLPMFKVGVVLRMISSMRRKTMKISKLIKVSNKKVTKGDLLPWKVKSIILRIDSILLN